MPNKWGLNLLKLNNFLNFAAWNRSIRLQKRIPQRSSHKASCWHKLITVELPNLVMLPKSLWDLTHKNRKKKTPKKETYATKIKKRSIALGPHNSSNSSAWFLEISLLNRYAFCPSVYRDLSGHLHGFQDGPEPSKIPAVGTWWLSISSINVKAYRHRPRRSQALTLAMREYGYSLLLYTLKKRESTTKAHRNGPRCLPAILAQRAKHDLWEFMAARGSEALR